MLRVTAALLAACTTFEILAPAAGACAQAVEPFQVVPIETPTKHSHSRAYLTMATGAGLVGLSFTLAHRADDAYADYLVSTDPAAIDQLYDRAVRNDHLSQASLLTGETLIAAGIYFRFVRRPSASRLSLSLVPSRCALSYRF